MSMGRIEVAIETSNQRSTQVHRVGREDPNKIGEGKLRLQAYSNLIVKKLNRM